jgi:Tfp pilus assembly protein PilO
MTAREKNLAIAVGLCAPLILGYFGWTWYTGAFTDRTNRLNTATKQLELLQAKQRYSKAQDALREQWKKDSLPDNKEAALNQFQIWLSALANKHQLSNLEVVGQFAGETKGVAKKFKFTLDALGSIDQFAKFLEEFSRIDRLQEVRSLTLEPEKSGKLRLSLTAEALALAGNRNTTLPEEIRTSLTNQDAAKVLASRNFFAEYVPPPPPRKVEPPPYVPPPPREPVFDFGKLTFVTAVIENNGEPEVWITYRPWETNGTKQLRAGESFQFDSVRGKVVEIDVPAQSVEIEIGNRKTRVTNGNSLAAGTSSGSTSNSVASGNNAENNSGRNPSDTNTSRGPADNNSGGRPSSAFGFNRGGDNRPPGASGGDSRGPSTGGDSRSRFRRPGN